MVSSRKFLLRHGVHHRGVISPTLFLLFSNDLVAELPRGVHAALYADDLVLWCKEEYATIATLRKQEANNKLATWAEDWCVSIKMDKSSTTLFTMSTKQKAGKSGWQNQDRHNSTQGRESGFVSRSDIWQKEDMEATHCPCKRVGSQETGNDAQACWNNMGSRRANTQDNISGNSETPFRV